MPNGLISVGRRIWAIGHPDKILILNAGAIVEQGTHDELLSLGGLYYDLYTSQFKGKVLVP
jgi:ABC-type multidrug transport system fused ATPase/permease subunit